MKAIVPVLLIAAACTPLQREGASRNAARGVISKAVAEQFPNLPLQPAVDCVAENATTPELFALASDTLTGPTAATRQTVSGIVARPSTVQCLATRGAAPFIV